VRLQQKKGSKQDQYDSVGEEYWNQEPSKEQTNNLKENKEVYDKIKKSNPKELSDPGDKSASKDVPKKKKRKATEEPEKEKEEEEPPKKKQKQEKTKTIKSSNDIQ